jgi:serine-type D-Ala-D-Ala carboxypeptidase/endopeptidase (penicillin-binding protein 4)
VARTLSLLFAALLLAAAVVPAVRVLRVRSDAQAAEAHAASLRTAILAPRGAAVVTVGSPILRVQRAPEALIRPVMDRRLAIELSPVVASWPEPLCLDVHIDGRQVFARDGGPQIPASVEKLITAAAVLTLIPPEERLVTSIVTDGELVPVADPDHDPHPESDSDAASAPASPPKHTVEGSVWIVGGGDPLLTTRKYSDAYSRQPQLRTPVETLAEEIAGLGITRINGLLVGDESRYDTVRYVETWPQRYRVQHNSGPLSALTLNDGFTAWEPTRTDSRDPARHFVGGLRDELRSRGVAVAAGLDVGPAPLNATVLATVESPPMVDIVQQMLRESDNNTAELLLKELGLRELGIGSTAAGAEVARRTVAELLPSEAEPVVFDGSGLDRGNQLTCSLLTSLLDLFGANSDLAAGLPVANQTGTLAHRFEDDPAAGRLKAKTGLLNNVNGLAGFVTNDGGTVTFAQLLNGVPLTGDLGTAIQEELVSVLLRHPGDLDADDIVALDDPVGSSQTGAQ